jgi:hypothetical protein
VLFCTVPSLTANRRDASFAMISITYGIMLKFNLCVGVATQLGRSASQSVRNSCSCKRMQADKVVVCHRGTSSIPISRYPEAGEYILHVERRRHHRKITLLSLTGNTGIVLFLSRANLSRNVLPPTREPVPSVICVGFM